MAAHGKTVDMILFTKSLRWYPKVSWEQKDRDRSLRGKDRIRARKAARARTSE